MNSVSSAYKSKPVSTSEEYKSYRGTLTGGVIGGLTGGTAITYGTYTDLSELKHLKNNKESFFKRRYIERIRKDYPKMRLPKAIKASILKTNFGEGGILTLALSAAFATVGLGVDLIANHRAKKKAEHKK